METQQTTAPAPTTPQNPLGYEKIPRLLVRFAVPSIVSGVVSATYNIVDQIFIGQGVGMLGNAATNVAFPLTTVCIATALLLGVGSASGFNLALGAGRRDEAGGIVGTGLSMLALCGLAVGTLTLLLLRPLMLAFGASQAVLPYALSYTGITAFGMPLLIFSTGASNLIRSDGSPTYSMLCILSGAILNTVLDPIFIFALGMGIEGAALATVLGQALSAVMALAYFFRFKTLRLTRALLRPRAAVVRRIASLGAAACFNQLSLMVVQIVLNNSLTHYGAQSHYGSEIPLAVVGIISKVNFIFMAVIIGIAQGNQPIVGFNYGAKKYSRVRSAYRLAAVAGLCVSTLGFILFQLFPTQIVGIFGEGSPEYFQFAERYFRVFMLCFFAIGLQPVTSNFFTSIGKAKMGILLSLTRQIIVLLPLILIFPLFFGVDGLMYAGPFSDGISAVLAILLAAREFRAMKALEQEQQKTET